MTDIKERPILFSAPMVRAILEGRKTVTRRVVKTQPRDDATIEVDLYNPVVVDRHGVSQPGPEIFGAFSDDGEWGSKFPYGRPGDQLWVRETTAEDCLGSISTTTYTADGAPTALEWWYSRRSCPSIHMPRAACRILLEITDVRVERLQDISDEQAIAEGCFFTDYGRKCFHGGRGVRDATECEYPDAKHDLREGWMWDKTTSHEQCLGAPRWAFANLWLSTGGNWDANPWVWVVEFKQVQAASGCGYERGDWECREGGFMFDAGSGEGWDPQDETYICPHCRTRDYLESAKEDAESCSKWSDCGSSGTGLDIWAGAESHALIANEPEARKALSEIGVVGALVTDQSQDGYSVVLCNTRQVTQ